MHDTSSARILLGYTYKKETLCLAREISFTFIVPSLMVASNVGWGLGCHLKPISGLGLFVFFPSLSLSLSPSLSPLLCFSQRHLAADRRAGNTVNETDFRFNFLSNSQFCALSVLKGYCASNLSNNY